MFFRRCLLLAPALLIATFAGCTDDSPTRLTLIDLSGKDVDPFASSGREAIVFVFVRTDCPISNRYAPELGRLHEKFAPRGVYFWLVYPDPDESIEAIRRHIETQKR